MIVRLYVCPVHGARWTLARVERCPTCDAELVRSLDVDLARIETLDTSTLETPEVVALLRLIEEIDRAIAGGTP